MGIKIDGTLWAWGFNSGSLGLGDATYRSIPVQIGTLTTWSQLNAGDYHTVAVKTDGTLWLWGANDKGYLGLGDTAMRSSPVQLGTLATWANAAASELKEKMGW